MPCNKLAVQTAQIALSPQLMRAVLQNPNALTALQDAMSTFAPDATVWNEAHSWHIGYQSRRQTIEVAQIAATAQQYVDFCAQNVAFRVHSDGRVEARDPWRLGYKHPNLDAFMATFVQAINQVAILIAQNLIAETIQAAGLQVLDQRTPTARVLTINVR